MKPKGFKFIGRSYVANQLEIILCLTWE